MERHTGSRENHSVHGLHSGDRCQVERMPFRCPQAGDGSPSSLANFCSDFGDSSLPAVGAVRERTLQNKNNDRKPPNRSVETGSPCAAPCLSEKREAEVGGERVPTAGPSVKALRAVKALREGHRAALCGERGAGSPQLRVPPSKV